jgi:hypothetical protein
MGMRMAMAMGNGVKEEEEGLKPLCVFRSKREVRPQESICISYRSSPGRTQRRTLSVVARTNESLNGGANEGLMRSFDGWGHASVGVCMYSE